MLGLCCCARAFSSYGKWGLLLVAAHELIAVGFPRRSAGKESACNAGDLGSIPGLGRSPGEGKATQLQYSGLENSMDCIVQGVAKSRIRLSDFLTAEHRLSMPGLQQLQQAGSGTVTCCL